MLIGADWLKAALGEHQVFAQIITLIAPDDGSETSVGFDSVTN